MTATAIPDALRPKLSRFVRLLGSDQPGEVVAAATALRRALSGVGADLNDLGDAIERRAEPLVVYVERQPRPTGAGRGHIDWSPAHRAHVSATLERGLLRLSLNEWERSFVANIITRLRSPCGRLTFKQAEVAERLVAKVEMSR